MLHICLITFISCISYTKVHLFISCTIVQLIHFHLIYFTDHSLSHSHSPYLVLLILHRVSASLTPSFFNQSYSWKLGVSLDKILIQNIYYIILNLKSDGITTPCHFIRITTIMVEESLFKLNFLYVICITLGYCFNFKTRIAPPTWLSLPTSSTKNQYSSELVFFVFAAYLLS